MIKYSLKPIISTGSRVLILGTMPGDESLRRREYYANTRNQFWLILESIYKQPVGHSYDRKLKFLYSKDLALWDVLQSAERSGSLDAEIRNCVPNNFEELLQTHRNIKMIAFNGKKAEGLFQKIVMRKQNVHWTAIKFLTLPSTSPTPGRHVLSLEEKIFKWRAIIIN